MRFSKLFQVAILPLAAFACSTSSETWDTSTSELTGISSAERGIHFQSYVYVPTYASDDDIKIAIARQVKTAIGALRNPNVSLDDRGALHNLDPSRWTRTVVTVKDPANTSAPVSQLLKVTYPYDDHAVVTNALAQRSAVDFTMLGGDYAQHDAALKSICSDDPTTDTDSLWYHYAPELPSCSTKIRAEIQAILQETTALGNAPGVIGPKEAGRWFMPTTARLDPPNLPGATKYPEYDRLYGVGTGKSQLVVYAFFGVDTDETNPDDILAQEAVKFVRTMLEGQPNFRVTKTDPQAMLLDIFVDGNKLPNVTYENLFAWILDKSGYPAEVGNDASKIADLRRQALAKFAERWIYWDLPVKVTAQGTTRDLDVQVRSFFGYEDGSADARQHAEWRYLEAFWYGDVFLYNGHSHFGHGPLEPNLYGPQNFNSNYQIMLVNSCISYNYYHEDFFTYKGGSANLDMVVNGLPSYVLDGGVATARLMLGLLDGTTKSYVQLLEGMRLDYPWGETGYDPMRVVDGELDNQYTPAKTALSIAVQPPLY